MNKDSNPATSKPSEVGAPDLTEIKITPAMIEAGLVWLLAFNRDYSDGREEVRRVVQSALANR